MIVLRAKTMKNWLKTGAPFLSSWEWNASHCPLRLVYGMIEINDVSRKQKTSQHHPQGLIWLPGEVGIVIPFFMWENRGSEWRRDVEVIGLAGGHE